MRSMTGFGRGEATHNQKILTVEMKSVNHRYCDINIRMPKCLFHIENVLKKSIKEKIKRGKVDVYINFEDKSELGQCVIYNKEMAQQYMDSFQKIQEDFLIDYDIKVSYLSSCEDVLTLEKNREEDEELETLALTGLALALENIIETRFKEGEMLKADLKCKLDTMLDCIQQLKVMTPKVIENYRNKLSERMLELTEQTDVSPERLAMEVALYADKSCIDEEIVRLESHIKHMRDTLDTKEPVGRKLDFISQEMNREANTVLSKSNHIEISNCGIELKTLIEKVREQIQNIE